MRIFNRHKKQFDKHLTDELRETDPTDTASIQALISQGADPNAGSKNGKGSPLVQAATCGCISTMQVLLDAGADVDKIAGYKRHFYPLMAAVYEAQREAAEFLLSHGARVDGPKFAPSPLSAAIEARNLDMMKLLLDHDARADTNGFGTLGPAWTINAKVCHHDLRKPPEPGCKKCDDRVFYICALSLLRQYGARPLVEGFTEGTGLVDAYIDLIAHREKLNERYEKAGHKLADFMINDPTIQMMTKWGVGGLLGLAHIPTPVTSIADLMGLPDPDGYERVKLSEPRPFKDRIFNEPPRGMMEFISDLKSVDEHPNNPAPIPANHMNS